MDQPTSTPAPAPAPTTPPVSDKDKEDRMTAALSYVSILFIIPMLKKDSEFCQWHAKQGIVLFIFSIAVSFLYWIPMGWRIAQLVSLLVFVVAVLAIIKTLKGERWEIPVIGKYASMIKF